ncbi:MAG: ADOP family duplicated permease [Acidobacteriota bacterium]
MRRLRAWLRALFRRRRLEDDLDAELRFHLERETEALIEAGLAPREARRRARAGFGGIDAIKEECREARGTYFLESTLQDLRYGLRMLIRYPGFTITAVATLALTIGAASTVLTLGHALFLQPLPAAEADELVELRVTRRQGREIGRASYPDYAHFRDSTRTLDGLAAVYDTAPLYVRTGDTARQVNGAVVSANFFSLMGLEPSRGRFFRADEDRVPGRDPVAILGHDFWHSRLGGDDEALGSTLVVNDVTFTVVGVAPPDFPGIGDRRIDIYMPTMMLSAGYRWCDDALAQDCTILRMIGRLEEDTTLEQAAAEMATLVPARWRQAEPGENSGIEVVRARRGQPGPTTTRFMTLLAWTVAALLLVCSANLAGLLVARGWHRAREMAVRASLGAPRSRLVRQLLNESLLLAAIGSGLGLLLSVLFTELLEASFFAVDGAGRPFHFDFVLDPAVVAVVLGLALSSGLLFGLLPALRSVRRGSEASLERAGSRRGSGPGAHRWLIAAQAAAAVTLLVVAALLVGSAAELLRGTNFEPDRVALLRLRPRLVEYSPARAQEFIRDAARRLRALPGVGSVSMVGTGVALFGFEAEVSHPVGGDVRVRYLEVGPDYFATLGTPVLRGREFDARDDTTAPAVAVVSEALADLLWPDGSALGAPLRVNGRLRTVVGIVADVPLQSRAEPIRPYAYVPFWQNPGHVDARLQVRVDGDPTAALPVLAREVREVDPAVPITELTTLEGRLAGAFRALRMTAAVVSYAAGLTVLLSALGLYASLTTAVSRRRHELGVRQALGASARGIIRLVAARGVRVVLVGALAGLALSAVGSRLVRHLLYGTPGADVPVYLGAAVVVVAVGLAASWLPARRAARIPPVEALRGE